MFADSFELELAQSRRLVDAAARASISIYIIDTRGLDHSWSSGALVTAPAPDPVYVAEPGTTAPWRAAMGKGDTFTMLTSDTGGMLVSNYNNFSEALAVVARDSSSYYVIGYQAADTKLDGRFRKIQVRVTRSNLKVRARKGYFATAGGGG